MYKTSNGEYALVISPYGYDKQPDVELFTETCGFIQIYPLYSENAQTFVKVGSAYTFRKDIRNASV